MRREQKVVVAWMQGQLDRMGWKPEKWARMAGLSPTTVTRAMNESYDSVSSVPTLHALAQAAGVPSVLECLDPDASSEAKVVHPPARVLHPILATVLPAAGAKLSNEQIGTVSDALAYALALLSPDNHSNAGAIRVAAEAAASRISPT